MTVPIGMGSNETDGEHQGENLSLPMGPHMSTDETQAVVEAVCGAL